MKYNYSRGENKVAIIYGETFASVLKKRPVTTESIVVLANQRYYDLFSEKINYAFGEQLGLNWYICRNDVHCNDLSELESVLRFLADWPENQDVLLIGLGNEGVLQLTAFLHQVSKCSSKCWLMPVSVQALRQGLLPSVTIQQAQHATMHIEKHSEEILFDSTLTNKKGAAPLIDLLVFIRAGLVCDYAYLQMLYQTYPDKKRLNQTSFNGILDELLSLYEQAGEKVDQFGRVFEAAFATTENGHLLSGPMKRLLGLLLQVLWSQQVNHFDFQFKNFIIWFIRLGFPVAFPKEILSADYAEQVLAHTETLGPPMVLEKIGQLGAALKPTPDQLLTTIDRYQEILKEI